MAKLPDNSLGEYLAMGPGRSYEALAKRYGVSKRAVVKRARREGWQGRIAEAEEAARKNTAAKAAETIGALNSRHLRTIRMIQARALETLKATPLRNAMDAIKALLLSLKDERGLLGLSDADQSEEAELVEVRTRVIDVCPTWQRDLLGYVSDAESLTNRKSLMDRFEVARANDPRKTVQSDDEIKEAFFDSVEAMADAKPVAQHKNLSD